MMQFEGKVALVTGASSGIGKAVAVGLAAQGATVIVNYSGNQEGAQAVVDQIISSGGKAEAMRCNVSQVSEVESMVDAIIEKHGRVDILVNNAGITKDTLILRMDANDFDKVIDINLKGTFNTLKSVSKYMMKQRYGKIINMASVIGITGNAGQANYAASKAGVIALTKSAAKELASRNILVNAVAPGYIDTKMTDVLSEKVKENILSVIPLKRTGKPEDVAKAVIFLASEESNYITGQVINVDGGMVM
jgi:3-oxoacyl-[acyl-carrier protein] reductase